MTQKTEASLKQARNELLKEYMQAAKHEKISVLVKIMDIDEEIESFKTNAMPTGLEEKIAR